MKIHEIIRKKRIEKGYTQEQMACFLGVSAPAVNKWEKAISYPDITLLPALARLLDTDLNTLLSFQDDLTRDEVGQFMNELAFAAQADGLDSAFHMALEKLHEYPSCHLLLLNTALTLEGMILTYTGSLKGSPYMDTIEELYTRASKSPNPEVGNQAKAMLVSKHIGRKEFDAAEKILKELPDALAFDKKQLTANLHLEQEEWGKAAELIEQNVWSGINSVQSSLYTLVEIAIKENREEDALKLTHITRQITELFDLWESNVYIVDFQLAAAKKDIDGCLDALTKMLPALNKEWRPKHSALYRHLPLQETNIGQIMRLGIMKELDNPENHEYDFLRDNPDIQNLLGRYR